MPGGKEEGNRLERVIEEEDVVQEREVETERKLLQDVVGVGESSEGSVICVLVVEGSV